jgi:cell wall-associated NlpC family hydrolase
VADANKGVAFGAIGVGSLLVYAGFKGYSLLKAARNLISGEPASKGQTANLLTVPASSASSSGNLGSGTGAAIAADAMSYGGHCYDYGGAPGTNGAGCWDCSSFVNWVIGHDEGLAIPFYKAGGYNGSSHGPPTGAWLVWTGCTTVNAADAEPGDIVVGVTHMGIYEGAGNYMSAHDPAEGTSLKPVSTFPDPIMLYRRLNAVSETTAANPGISPTQQLANIEAAHE